MENDHKNIREFSYLLENFSKESLNTMKTLHLNDETITEFPDSKFFSLFSKITTLSMTFCTFNDFKASSITRSCLLLKKIDLTGCFLPSIQSIVPLGKLNFLEELNLSQSSITLDRYYLLSYLFHGHTIIATAKPKKKIQRAFPISKSILCQNKPAPVPREGNFPRLQLVNRKIITESEVESVTPKKPKPLKVEFSDPILEKVKKTNEKILKDKEKFGSLRVLLNPSSQTSNKPHVDTFERVIKEKQLITLETSKSSSSEFPESKENSSSEDDWMMENPYKTYVPKNKEETEDFLKHCKSTRELASKPIEKKLYNFQEVCFFMYGKIVQEPSKVNSVCEVLRIVNGVKQNNGISEQEVYARLKNPKNLSIDDMHQFQQILLLDDEIRSMRLQSAYFEWWIKKIEKKHVEFAEHKAILALHKNRVFNNPNIGTHEKTRKRLVRQKSSEKDSLVSIRNKKIILDQEPQYFEANFSKLFDSAEIKQGPVYFIKPIVSFEESIEKVHNQLLERERQFENLSFGDKVLVKLEKLKNNIKEREGLRDRLSQLFDQVLKLKKKFQENQVEYFYNMYEKKLDKREALKNHDYRKFELPTFIFPIIK
jgi:hypothetical protein